MRHIKNFPIFEAIKLSSNILDILQELKDNGFKCEVKKYWTSKDFTPFNTTLVHGYKKHPGICSTLEIKNGHLSYHIRFLSKQGLDFDKFQDMFDAFRSATDRLEEMGKVFRKVNSRTDDSGKIKPGFHIWFITNEISTEDSKTKFIRLISPTLKILKATIPSANDTNVSINLFPNLRDKNSNRSTDIINIEKFAKSTKLLKELKSVCAGKYLIRTSGYVAWDGIISIYFSPI